MWDSLKIMILQMFKVIKERVGTTVSLFYVLLWVVGQ